MLRNVELDDIEIFYTQEADPVANAMAAFPARDRTAHAAHWQKVLAHDSNVARTIVEQGQVVGYIGSWDGAQACAVHDGRRTGRSAGFPGRSDPRQALGRQFRDSAVNLSRFHRRLPLVAAMERSQ